MQHEDGIHFGLPAATYHSDQAIGSTGMKRLVISPAEWFWHSDRNPMREPDEPSDAKALGDAIHSLVLEGEEHFTAHFAREISVEDYPGALRTTEELRDFLDSRGRKPKSYKRDLIAQVLEEPDRPPVWDIIKAEFDRSASGKTVLKPKAFQRAMISAKMITAHPDLAPAFVGGVPEVSVFWTVNGVRLKARFDYLKINSTVDLKSFSPKSRGRSIRGSIFSAVSGERYDIQAAHYDMGRMQFPRFLKEGRVFGDHDPAWLQRVAANREWSWVWVFYKTVGAPIARGTEFHKRGHEYEAAQRDITRALESYREYEERFGDGMWVDITPIETIGDGDLPSWTGQ